MKEFEKFIKHLKLEAVALALLMAVLTYYSSAPLWILPLTFILFDIGMIGYLIDNRTGALTYNVTHNLTIPTLLIASGLVFGVEVIAIVGYCWTFHIAIDRALGFGLKHKHSFHETHMGHIKNKSSV